MQELNTFFQAKAKRQSSFPLLATLNFSSFLKSLPQQHRSGRRRSNSTRAKSQHSSDNVASLQTSFSIAKSIRALRRHRWSLWDIQYLILAAVDIFSLCIMEPAAPLVKVAIVCGYLLLLLMPVTRQFFLPSLPIWTYLLYFFSSRFIPTEVRPHIWVKVLPALENVLYGANLSNILSAHTHPILDVIAWIPYGLGHFALPAICSAIMFLFAAPGTVPMFARSFGWMSMLGVTMALVFPCTPPWYENMYGLAPAHYGMPGSPAGLARVDALLGVDMYTTSFSTAPVPFGAFPSLHAADATLEALFMSHCFPKFRPIFIFYVVWIWWATMYLSHHYAVDLVAGSLVASVIFFIVRTRWLPHPQAEKSSRWQYDFVEVGELKKAVDEEYGYSLGLLERRGTGDSDEWSLGSSSAFSLGSSAGSGMPSPQSPPDESREGESVVAGMTHSGQLWDGHAPARDSDVSDVVVMK